MNTKYHSMAEHFITYFTFNASLTLFNFFNTFPFILNNFNVYLCSSPPSSIMAFAMNIYLWFCRCDVITMTTLKWIFGILGRSLYFWYLIIEKHWMNCELNLSKFYLEWSCTHMDSSIMWYCHGTGIEKPSTNITWSWRRWTMRFEDVRVQSRFVMEDFSTLFTYILRAC